MSDVLHIDMENTGTTVVVEVTGSLDFALSGREISCMRPSALLNRGRDEWNGIFLMKDLDEGLYYRETRLLAIFSAALILGSFNGFARDLKCRSNSFA